MCSSTCNTEPAGFQIVSWIAPPLKTIRTHSKKVSGAKMHSIRFPPPGVKLLTCATLGRSLQSFLASRRQGFRINMIFVQLAFPSVRFCRRFWSRPKSLPQRGMLDQAEGQLSRVRIEICATSNSSVHLVREQIWQDWKTSPKNI